MPLGALEGATLHPVQMLVPSQLVSPGDLELTNSYVHQTQLATSLDRVASATLAAFTAGQAHADPDPGPAAAWFGPADPPPWPLTR